MNRLFLLSCIVLLSIANLSFAQHQLPKFENITPLDLRANWKIDYPYADAIILQDYGEISLDLNSGTRAKVRYTYHRRIKILNEKGLSYASVRIPLKYNNGRRIRLQKLQATTYRLNGAGKVMKADVSKRNVSDEEINEQLTEVSFDFPLVEVGAILEYTYTYLDEDIKNLNLWKFQDDLPIVISEYHTYFPGNFHYLQLSNGDLSAVDIKRESYRQRSYFNDPRASLNRLSQNPSMLAGNYERPTIRGIHSIYVAENMPPVEIEPHIQSIEDYIPGVKFYLPGDPDRRNTSSFSNSNLFGRRSNGEYRKDKNSEESKRKITRKSELLDIPRLPHELPGFRWLDIPGTSHRQQARNWDGLSRNLLRNQNFGKYIDKSEILAQRGARVARRHEEVDRKAKAIYESVRKRMSWDGTYGLFPSELDEAYTEKKGSGSTINFVLLNMLRGAGLNAYPVILRTRDEGSVLHVLPNVETFNHVVVAVQLPEQIALLDATSRVVSFGMLPENDLNMIGFVVDRSEWGWVQINPEDVFSRTCGSFNLESDGMLKGRFEITHTEYSAAIERGKWLIDSLQNDEYLQQYVLSGLQDREVLDYQVQYLEDTEQPFIVTCDLETSAFVETVDDYMFVSPMMTRMIAQNPFPPRTRLYPISFPAPTRDYYLFGMKIPEGYEVAQMPSPIFVRLGQDGGAFVYNVFLDGEYLFITSAIHLAQTYFNSRAYSELTNFFDYVVSKHSEDIVLKKVQQVN